MSKDDDEEVADRYFNELATLKLNSKPLINSLTMMAEDHMKQAHVIVQTIEKQLMTVRPNFKLPILYLIDSIVKNVKKNYVALFTQNIVSIFSSVFEKVDETTRAQMFKLRQTWNEVFPSKKLYSIDVRVHQIDSGWPITTPPSPSIHVNPKFLSKGTLVLPGSSSNSFDLLPSLKDGPVDDATEAQMREQLLIKQKELIDLQQKKLELELMHAKAKLEEQERIKKLKEGADRQEQLMKQAEIAKHQTDRVTSMMALAGNKSIPTFKPTVQNTAHPPQINAVPKATTNNFAADPRLNRIKDKMKSSLYNPDAKNKMQLGNDDLKMETLPKLSVPPSRSPTKNSPMPAEKIKRETVSDSRSRSPSHSTTSFISEPKETTKENRKRHIQDADLFNEETDTNRHRVKTRHKSSKNSTKEREPEKESFGRGKSAKKEKSSKSSSSSSLSESVHRRGKDLPELVSSKKESGSNNGNSNNLKTPKRDSDEDYEDEMLGYSALTIKPKRNDINTPSSLPERRSPSKVSIDRKDPSLSPKSPNKSKEIERLRKSTPRSSPSPAHDSPTKLQPNTVVGNIVSSSTPTPIVHVLLPTEKKVRSKDKSLERSERERDIRRVNKRTEKMARETKEERSKDPTKDRESRKLKQDKEKEQYVNRKSAVLSRNYRKRQDPNAITSYDDGTGKSENSTDPLVSGDGDIDLRFEILQDVDLRSQEESEGDQPLPKKPRNSAVLINDLFGQEDVDLRPSSSNWSQVKKPSSSPLPPTPFRRNNHGHGREELDIPSSSENYEDINEILRKGRVRPPPAISPANSVDSTRSSCDPLGRPLLFARLPDDPEERKRSLDLRSSSIDPVEQFCVRYIDKPSMRIGGLTQSDLNFAFTKSQQELDNGNLTAEQHNDILKRLVQVNEFHKIQQLQQMKEPNGPRNGQGPWAGNALWQPPRPNFGGPRGGGNLERPNRFPGHGPMQRQPWGVNQWGGGAPRPRGPNPFVEAMPRPDDFVPEANRVEVTNAERDMDSTIPLDKIPRQIRFYGETAIVFLGIVGDEPREISFQKGGPSKVVYVGKEPFKCTMGQTRSFYIGKNKHTIRIGTPKRELYIDGEGYETCFGGPPISVQIQNEEGWHTFKLEGPPPQVEVGKERRYDLVAGRVTLFIDSNSVPIYLDAKAQLLDLCGFPVILKFSEDFHGVTLNGRPFPTNFGGSPMPISLPNGRQHFLRFAAVSPATEQAMHTHVRLKHEPQPNNVEELPPSELNEGQFGPTFRGRGHPRGRGMRGRGVLRQPGGFVPLNAQLNRPEPVERVARNQEDFNFMEMDPALETNPLDTLATYLPHSSHSGGRVSRNPENAYESDASFREENEGPQPVDSTSQKSVSGAASQPLSVEDLLNSLLRSGILQPVAAPKENEIPEETKVNEEKVPSPETEKAEENPVADSTTLPPLETVDVSLKDNMRERRAKLIDQICTGIQCASCGLRFAPDQTFGYTKHLDWHFRQNRRDKGNSRKALSRKWYYDLSDWLQFQEIDEERADSTFESTEVDMEGDEKNTGTILNPDSYTVLAAGHDGDLCPQCGEGFETFYDEEEEEWRLRDAFMSPETEGESSKLYHPICHQDYIASLQEVSMVEPEPQEPSETEPTSNTDNPPEEDDEVLFLKEGKKDVVLMEIDVEDDEVRSDIVKDTKESENDQMLENNTTTKIDSTIVELEKINIKEIESLPLIASLSSRSLLSPILIHDDESNSNIPGILTSSENGSGVFGFALGLDSSHGQQQTTVEEPKRISYNSWQFDFPKIKIEPPEWENVAEGQVIMSQDYQVEKDKDPVNITLDDDTSQSPPSQVIEKEPYVDIDLTEEDEVSTTPVGSLVAEIDGNLEFKGDNLIPLVPPTKIRINITGLSAVSSSASPSRKSPVPPHDEISTRSPTRLASDSQDSTDTGVNVSKSPKSPEPDTSVADLEELKRLKPRLVGRKLVNQPLRIKGKEESGLCVIC